VKKRIAIFTIQLLLVFFVSAQEEYISPPSKRLTKFTFTQLSGGVVLIHARLDNFPDTLNFIFDTGSSGISLDSTTIDYFNLKPQPTERTIRGIAGIKKVSFLYNRKLHLEGLSIDSLNFHINDYDVLTSVYGLKIDGIIGYAVLSRYIVKLDYDLYTMEVWSRGTLRYPKGGYLFKPNITTLPVQNARVKDAVTIGSRFLYDIGAALCLLLTTDFVTDSAFLDKKRKLYVKEAEGVGGKVDMQITVVKELKLGPYRFRNVPTYIFEDVNNITSYPYLSGLIGNDILRRFNTIFNYEKEEFYLLPNTHFADAFDYAYTGVELYFVDGDIIAGDVAKGSPAEESGLREGDVILAINKNFTQNLTILKQALQVTNEKIKIVVRRNNQLVEIEFKAKSLLSR
jgi:PDZ domain/Aspartyl protease